jgi:myxalamid-type polyketide synthase MxaE and MxaD
VHLACQSIWAGECPLALVGAANVILSPYISIAYSQSRMLAADGRCKFGDASGDGYVRSEGAAVLVLKPFSAALRDGDRVRALVLGTSLNNDGATSGSMTTPGQGGQEDDAAQGLPRRGRAAGQVRYVEAHGTGLALATPSSWPPWGPCWARDDRGTNRAQSARRRRTSGTPREPRAWPA